jgi:alpha,alpha-trehalose phosphorylase
VEVTPARATYTLLEGPPLELAHHGEVVTVTADEPLTLVLPPIPPRPRPTQPRGRAPARRGTNEREELEQPEALVAN